MATNVDINTGTTVGISAGLPTTYDDDIATGYASLTFTTVGEIIDVGEIAKTFAMISHQALGRAYPQKLKDTYDIPDVSFSIGKYDTDGGQVILQTALDSSASFSFEVTLPSGSVANFTGKVTKAGIGALASGSVSMTVVSVAIDPETLYEA